MASGSAAVSRLTGSCSVANLLNGPSLLGQQITGILNIVQQLLGIPSLLNL